MRSDLKDVIIDTYRLGGKWVKPKRCKTKREDTGVNGSMSSNKNYGWYGKELSDRLKPLYGLLRKNVGRPWNNVYSEICQNADKRTIRGYHLRDHIQYEVIGSDGLHRNKVVLVDGVPHQYSHGHLHKIGVGYYLGGFTDFYVHPVTGILCAAHDAPRTKVQKNSQVRSLLDRRYAGSLQKAVMVHNQVYLRSKDVWYKARMEQLGEVRWGSPVVREHPIVTTDQFSRVNYDRVDYGPKDIILQNNVGRISKAKAFETYRRRNVYCAGLGQKLTDKQVTKLGLANFKG